MPESIPNRANKLLSVYFMYLNSYDALRFVINGMYSTWNILFVNVKIITVVNSVSTGSAREQNELTKKMTAYYSGENAPKQVCNARFLVSNINMSIVSRTLRLHPATSTLLQAITSWPMNSSRFLSKLCAIVIVLLSSFKAWDASHGNGLGTDYEAQHMQV